MKKDKSKFFLPLLPTDFVLLIATKTNNKEFTRLYRANKWISEIIERARYTFRKIIPTYNVKSTKYISKEDDLDFFIFKNFYLQHYTLFKISELTKVAKLLSQVEIHIDTVHTCNPLLQEVVTATKPRKLAIVDDLSFEIFPQQLDLPVETVEIHISTMKIVEEIAICLTGKNVTVTLDDWSDLSNTKNLILEYLKQLRVKQCKSNINFDLRRYNEYNDPLFIPSNSQSVYVFRGMAQGRGGGWKYVVRLETFEHISSTSGAIFYTQWDQHLPFEKYNKIEYFPTFRDFLICFEEVVGLRRNARDWMQLKKGDRIIAPVDDDYRLSNRRGMIILQDPREEAKHFDEIRYRFFL